MDQVSITVAMTRDADLPANSVFVITAAMRPVVDRFTSAESVSETLAQADLLCLS